MIVPELTKTEARAIRNQIVELRLKTMYKPNPQAEKKIERLLETLYPISEVSDKPTYAYDKPTPCFKVACGKVYPKKYWSKKKVIEEHSLKCRICNLLLGYTQRKTGFTQDEVAQLFEIGKEGFSSFWVYVFSCSGSLLLDVLPLK